MDIKEYLKKVGISKQEFANEIRLSRPTLDSYIDIYEKGETISKDRYQIIFTNLFEKELDAEIFRKKLDSLKRLLDRDERLGTDKLEAKAADVVSRINNRMLDDMSKEDWNISVYIFIDMLIKNYRNNEIFEKLSEYFVYLNRTKLEDDILDEQIPYFAQFYKAFSSLRDNPTLYDDEDFCDFMNRREQLIIDRENENKKKEENIKDLVGEAIKKIEDSGNEVTETEILNVILDKLKN